MNTIPTPHAKPHNPNVSYKAQLPPEGLIFSPTEVPNPVYVVILTNIKHTFLRVATINNMEQNLLDLKNSDFYKNCELTKLVHIELFNNFDNANKREETLAKWPKNTKHAIIKKNNPSFKDMTQDYLSPK